MNWDQLRAFCLSLPEAVETFPFEPTVSVFKAPNGRMFGVSVSHADPVDISVKCDPERGRALRDQYADVVEGYHLDKRHWITVTLNGDVPDALVRELVEDSYDLVASKASTRSR
jgi:predicted DNA-binding protein (MmcQ/YjbR family)